MCAVLTALYVLRLFDIRVVHPCDTRRIILCWCHCFRYSPPVQKSLVGHYGVIVSVVSGSSILVDGSFVRFVVEYTEGVDTVIAASLAKIWNVLSCGACFKL